MPLAHIEHFLIAANDMQQTRDWYCIASKPGPVEKRALAAPMLPHPAMPILNAAHSFR